jgi:hypothetical protein
VPVIRLDHMVIAVSDWQRPSTSIVRLSAPRSSTAAPTGSAFASRSCNSMSTVRASTRRPTWSACRCPLETVISAFAGTARSRKLLRTFDYTTSKWRRVRCRDPELVAGPSTDGYGSSLTSATVGRPRSPGSTESAATALRHPAIGVGARAAVARSPARGVAAVNGRSPTPVMASACPAAPCLGRVRCTVSAPVDNAVKLMDARRTPPPH